MSALGEDGQKLMRAVDADHREREPDRRASLTQRVSRFTPFPLSARTWGVLAVVGLIVAFSLSSTLVKRADTPGGPRRVLADGGRERRVERLPPVEA